MPAAKIFELYSQRLWPAHRWLARGCPRRCRRCILSERCVPLRDGLCPDCRILPDGPSDSQPAAGPLPNGELDEALQSLIGAGRGPYDVALLLSGGKDSAYVLRRLRRRHPDLRILGVCVDNGFMPPSAASGAWQAASLCQTDLLVDHSHRAQFSAALRQAFLSGRGCYEAVDRADGSLIYSLGDDAARQAGAAAVVSGLSWAQAQRILGLDSFVLRQEGRLDVLLPLVAWRTGEDRIRQDVRRWGLLPAGGESPLASNSELALTMGVVDCHRLGYCSFEPEFAQLVREGKADRLWWLRVFELLEHSVRRGWLDKEADKQLRRLGLTLEEALKCKPV